MADQNTHKSTLKTLQQMLKNYIKRKKNTHTQLETAVDDEETRTRID